jgi:hypothetical protein
MTTVETPAPEKPPAYKSEYIHVDRIRATTEISQDIPNASIKHYVKMQAHHNETPITSDPYEIPESDLLIEPSPIGVGAYGKVYLAMVN